MTAKEYLEQARYLDMRIGSKLEQVSSLNELATKCTAVMTGMPHNPSKNISQMADTINKIIDMENEINSDIDKLIDLKNEIADVINSVENSEYRNVLEKRYLCFKRWEAIAVEMGYSVRSIHYLHNRALKKIEQRRKFAHNFTCL